MTALTKEQFEDVNGFSNGFYGWGGEDDDLFHRVTKKGYSVFRYPGNIGRYSMLKHDKVRFVGRSKDVEWVDPQKQSRVRFPPLMVDRPSLSSRWT